MFIAQYTHLNKFPRSDTGRRRGGAGLYVCTYIINEWRHATSPLRRGGAKHSHQYIHADYTIHIANTYTEAGGGNRQAAVAPGGKGTAIATIVDIAGPDNSSNNIKEREGTDSIGETIDIA